MMVDNVFEETQLLHISILQISGWCLPTLSSSSPSPLFSSSSSSLLWFASINSKKKLSNFKRHNFSWNFVFSQKSSIRISDMCRNAISSEMLATFGSACDWLKTRCYFVKMENGMKQILNNLKIKTDLAKNALFRERNCFSYFCFPSQYLHLCKLNFELNLVL